MHSPATPHRNTLTATLPAMDVRAMAYESVFDVAFSNAALHWVPERDLCLETVFRALKPGGRLLFQMGGYRNAAEFFAVARTLIAEHPGSDTFRGSRPPGGFFPIRSIAYSWKTRGSRRSGWNYFLWTWSMQTVRGLKAGSVPPGFPSWSGSRTAERRSS